MNGRHSILRLAVIAAAVWPLAAMEVPQTRQEFVEAVAAGKGATRMEKLVVERDFDEIYRLLAMKSATCLDVQVRRWIRGESDGGQFLRLQPHVDDPR